MSLRNPQQVNAQGVSPTFTAVDGGGDTMLPDDRCVFEVKNTGGGAGTVTLEIPGSRYGQNNPDVPINVPATTGHVRIGPLAADMVDPATGLVRFTYSGGTLTCALVRI